jgi:glutamate dehydrogenase/leucine dehydrogenase
MKVKNFKIQRRCFSMEVNMELVKGIGKVGWKLSKAIVKEGSKMLLINAATTGITTIYDEGFEGLKDLTFDDMLESKTKKLRKKLFEAQKKNKKAEKAQAKQKEGNDDDIIDIDPEDIIEYDLEDMEVTNEAK